MDLPSSPASQPGDAAVLGELVVGNGRLIGTRRSLTAPLTLVGEGSGCDIRLHHEKVAPFHCVLFHGPDGFVIRNLDASDGTRVNGELVETRPLRHGDDIEVGPYHLVLEMPNAGRQAEAPTAPALEAERDALRIQAAAVVAQQAALTEEELRLVQRRGGLERQEEQLANHLEEKRRQLVEQREQLRAERDAFKEERAEEERKAAARHEEAEKVFAEADEDRKLARHERARFIELRKRLKHRWEGHFSDHEAELRQREQILRTATNQLDGKAAELERERAALSDQRLQYNGEMELGRRQLERSWEELSLAQQEWEACLNREKTEYEQREREVAEREQDTVRREKELAEDQRTWEQIKAAREQEAQGLEARIRNQREKLQELATNSAAASSGMPAAPVYVGAVAAEGHEAPVSLKRLAGCLADQRLHLLEQWRDLLVLQDHWQRQREAVLAELEDSGRRLAEREHTLAERERHLTASTAEFELRQELLEQLRCTLDGRQARLTISAQEWEAERTGVLAAAQASEQSAVARVQRLRRLSRRTARRHLQDAEALQAARARCDETRKQYAMLREECRSRSEELLGTQQTVTCEMLAVERLRLDVLGKSDNAAAAEKRLDRLRRQSQELVHQAEAEVERERQALLAEAGRLEERDRALRQDEDGLMAWRRDLAKRQRRLAKRTERAQDVEAQHTQEMQGVLAQHEQDAKHLRELREEVERLAGLMMNGPAPTTQAA